MTTTSTRYLAAILPLGVAVLGVFDAAQRTGTALLGWQTITQLILLLATTGAALVLPLVPGKWAGALKTGAAIVGAIVSALIATIPDGHFTQATLILFLTAALKAVAVQVGVTVRTDAAKVVDAGSTSDPGVPSITTVSASPEPLDAEDLDLSPFVTHTTAPDGSLVPVVGGAESEQSGTVPDDDAPKHLATS
ncbi:hypothetical protein [Curtobacterium sp. Curtsp57]|uniref:hypothetical protein n=1 Tax=Curtobacterium sp. Curtsp57 TaxID=3243047 RepID=UPI0039B3E3FC